MSLHPPALELTICFGNCVGSNYMHVFTVSYAKFIYNSRLVCLAYGLVIYSLFAGRGGNFVSVACTRNPYLGHISEAIP
jgi:hypothetical protein